MFRVGFLLLGLMLAGPFAGAAGPRDVAKANQALWPTPITDSATYNEASRAEILAFLKIYREFFRQDPSPEALDIKKVNAESVKTWKERSAKLFLNAFLDGARDCAGSKRLGCGFQGATFPELLSFSEEFAKGLPAAYAAWLEMSTVFYRAYLLEQARLAALFPNPTSEALPLAKNEVFGDGFRDGEFLLTFDDGPTPIGGDTEKYASLLRQEKISAYFFVLGNALEPRMKKSTTEALGSLYEKECLASHGFEHKSHQKWAEWKSSLEKTKALIRQVVPTGPVSFRPPYGQRTVELSKQQEQDGSVVLWNIDSQDWHSKIDSSQVGDRVQKLMLLWRKGIILFHDVHPKALVALPQLLKFAKAGGLRWVDCHSLK